MADQNYNFMSKQLALGALPSGSAEDFPGGVLVGGEQRWAAVWSPEEIGDPEPWIRQLQASAEVDGTRLAGVLLIQPIAAASSGLEHFTDALFVYGVPEVSALPGLIMLPGKAVHPKPVKGLSVAPLSAEHEAAAQQYLLDAQRDGEPLSSPLLDSARLAEAPRYSILLDGAPAGLLILSGAGLLRRVDLIWLDPAQRGHGAGLAAMDAIAGVAQGLGALSTCAWCQREGMLRYFLAKCGYQEQLRARLFVAE